MKILKKYLLLGAVVLSLIFANVIAANAIPVDQQFINQNRSYRELAPQGLVIHDTCDEGGTAQNNRDYFNRVYVGSSAHYFIDWKGIIQCVPESEQAWHAGPFANYRYLSIEMCNPSGYNLEQFNQVYKNTVSLAVDLCLKYNWNANNIFSHKYISNTYKQTDHEDPNAFLEKYGKSWDTLVNDITATLNVYRSVSYDRGYIVTNYLPNAYAGYNGVNVDEITKKYFKDVTTYVRRDNKGIWIETQYLSKEKCEELKNNLGSLFYSIQY